VLPRATGKNPSRLAAGVHFWLALLGVTFYVLSLSVAGTLQGMAWVAGDPFIKSVESAQPFWVGRAVAGTMMFVAHLVFAYNVYRMTWAKPQVASGKAPASSPVPA
jgi:cytochrome c oxidase cbb3-type subunit 1